MSRALVTVAVLAIWTPAMAAVRGVVVDDATGAPIAGAQVRAQGTAGAVTTDASGGFSLAIADGASVTVVAAHRGHFNAAAVVTAPADVTLRATLVPTTDDPAYSFRTAQACGGCHPDQVDEWTGSAMAKAGTNSWVHDLYAGNGTPGGGAGFVYARDSVHRGAVPHSECASCHQPEVWAATPFVGMLGPSELTPAALHGVSCEICHRIADVDEARPNFPGLYPGAVTMARGAATDAVQFGVLGDTSFVVPGTMQPAYNPELVAEVCAACHQDKNDPDEDGDFEEPDGVISEPTYLEWKASAYGDPASPTYQTCVDCHMGGTERTAACTVVDPTAPPRPPGQVRSHRIEGTTAPYLEHAVRVTATAQVVDDELEVTATITNDQTGHSVPTGVTIRNVILLIEATGADGAALPLITGPVVDPLGGVGDPAAGYVAGLPGRLYAKVPEAATGAAPVFYTDAVRLRSDNRIAAGASDATSYRFALPASAGAGHVTARVIYRRSYRAVVDLKGWTRDGHGQPLEDLAPPHFGHLMAQADLAIELPPPAADAGCGCAADGDRGAGPALALLVLGLVRRRRAPPPRS